MSIHPQLWYEITYNEYNNIVKIKYNVYLRILNIKKGRKPMLLPHLALMML